MVTFDDLRDAVLYWDAVEREGVRHQQITARYRLHRLAEWLRADKEKE